MSSVLCQVIMPYTTGLPEDISINTFAFSEDGADPIDIATSWSADLQDFYNTTQTGASGNPAQFLSNVLDRGANKCLQRWFQVTTPGVPNVELGPVFLEVPWTLDPFSDGALPLPLEVAIVSSFYSGQNPHEIPLRRRRGRIYLGPVTDDTISFAGSYPYVNAAVQENVAAASLWFAGRNGTNTGNWSVWSRAEGVFSPIDSGWVNNEFDTQRRRQAQATSRENWTTGV